MKKLALLLLLSFALNAYCSDWRHLAGDEQAAVRVDASSIRQVGQHRKAWLMWDYQEPQKRNSYDTFSYKSTKTLNYYKCSERTSTTVQATGYSGWLGTGESQAFGTIPLNKAVFSDVIPDTYGEMILDFVCAFPLPKGKS